jgi:endonuclease YncB( thermonuclease family)
MRVMDKKALAIGIIAILLLFSVFFGVVEANHYVKTPCKVLKVIDGDTIDIRIPYYEEINHRETLYDTPFGGELHETERLRLEEVDCPEMDTHEGEEAKAFTKQFLSGGDVSVRIYIVGLGAGQYVKKGKDNRLIGDLVVDGKSLSHELVRNGFAIRMYEGSDSVANR